MFRGFFPSIDLPKAAPKNKKLIFLVNSSCCMFIFLVKYLHRKQIQEYDMSPAELAALEAVLVAHGEVIPAIAIPALG